jgi:hypothetical protein
MVNLTTVGLHRLKVTKAELIDSAAVDYLDTAAWAEALHREFPVVDGLFWMSRKFDCGQALMLFGDRMEAALEGKRTGGTLRSDDELRRVVLGLALRAGILVA